MKLKKVIAFCLSLLLTVGLLAGCGTTVVVLQEQPAQEPAQTEAPAAEKTPVQTEGDAVPVKLGLSFVTSTTSSTAATAEADGVAQSDISLVAVTVDDNGVIDSCVIDAVQAKIGFNAKGELTGDLTAPILSKNELGTDYGMGKFSPIGKEWNEQAAALADYVVGLTLEEVQGIVITAEGKPEDADLASSVTIYMGGLLSGIEEAVNNARHLGSNKGDRLVLNTLTSVCGSKAATAEEAGLAQAYCTVAAMTMRDDTITGCYLDAVQANVNFDTNGAIAGELSGSVASKNMLGDDYGMHAYSSIGADWHTQAASFSRYVTGKTIAAVSEIAVSEGKTTDADLVSSVTMGIGDFLELIAKAG